MKRSGTPIGRAVATLLLAVGLAGVADAQDPAESARKFVGLYCAGCHDGTEKAGGLDLEAIAADDPTRHPEVWEKVIRQVGARQMPPEGSPRAKGQATDSVVAWLAATLDRRAAEHPEPGRTDTFRRLNRTEYQNAIRDLLAIEVDASTLLPGDESSHGFDNVTVGDLSPTLLDRYITASQKISRLALGTPGRTPGGDTFRVKADVTQEEHVEGLPIGTRGGTLIPYTFPEDGEYDLQVRLARDRNEQVEGLREPHELEILVDRDRAALLTILPPRSERDHGAVDEHLKIRIKVKAGPRQVGVTFIKKPSSLLETKRQPYQAHYNMHRHPRITPAVYQVSITGPYAAKGHGDTPSRRRILAREPKGPADEDACGRDSIAALARRAYRRPVTAEDLATPLAFYRSARAEGGDFDSGIEMALSAILVNPNFLFRVERDPPGLESGTAYRVDDVSLASRLSFFLWSSIPDDTLLDLATRGELARPEILEAQVRRMLADPRASSLATNFAGQWLHLRNLDSITPDLRLFPDFDDNLRQAFRRETELLFEEVVRDDRSVLALIKSDHAYLNERLARHYGIPHVAGSHFRRVAIDEGGVRGGLLRQGSVLMVTSYATRTSPTIRGKWILDNLLGTPPSPPPPNVPALKDNTVDATLSVRDRLAEHRRNEACASCHNRMDPPGFALEHFDAVGRWQGIDDGRAIDASGGLPDGSRFDGVDGLEAGLLKRPELFVGTLAEKLLMFALGRIVDDRDGPSLRKIVRDARAADDRFSSLILGIATSTPFRLREAE